MKSRVLSYRYLFLSLCASSYLFMSSAQAFPLNDVHISGNSRVDGETIRSYIAVKQGEEIDESKINLLVKTLYATGFFTDVRVIRSNNDLNIVVAENSVISAINFEGQDRFKPEDLQQEILIKQGDFLRESALKTSVERLIELYKRSGRYAATVTPKIVKQADNRVGVIFEINEGEVAYVRKINFIGNSDYSDSELRDALATREERWWRILSSVTTYDPDRLMLDKSKLREFYLDHGYVDFQIDSAVAEMNKKGDGFTVTFVINEGKHYNVGKVELSSSVKLPIANEELFEEIQFDEGDRFSETRVEKSKESIALKAAEAGYPFVETTAKFTRHPQEQKVDIAFNVQRASQRYVERINVSGNVRTIDSVIRRELELSEGDALNKAKIERSKRSLKGLGYFKNVEIKESQGSDPNKVVLDVNVEEMPTGDITFGIGYSTTDQVIGEVSLTERNLLGEGYYGRIGAMASGRRKEFDLSFTDPFFLGRRVAAGFDVYHYTNDYRDIASYDEVSTGVVLRSGFNIGQDLTLKPRYKVNTGEITNLRANVSEVIKDAADRGRLLSSSLGYEIAYDKRDDLLLPTAGYRLSLAQDVAGVGGDVKLTKSTAQGIYYYTPFDGYTLSFQMEGGVVLPYGGYDLRIIDRYFLGGNSFRGFEIGGIGPRVTPGAGSSTNDDTVGGSYYAVNRTELNIPIAGLDEVGMSGALFSDIGTLWHVDNQPNFTAGDRIVDDQAIRASVGFGVKWQSPMGPIRLDFAKAVKKQEYDKTEVFRFSAGSRF